MITLSPKRNALNTRELTYYLLFAAILLFGLAGTAATFWYLHSPKPQPIEVGPVAGFPPAPYPYPVHLEEAGLNLFIVNTNQKILVFDRRTPLGFGLSCLYQWEEANGRFVEPCYGSQFTLDGRRIQSPAPRNLDQYPVTIKNGRLFIDPTQRILGDTAEPLCYLTNECP